MARQLGTARAVHAVAAATVVAVLGGAGSPAHAVLLHEGSWDEGVRAAACTTGQNKWRCTYEFAASDCLEASIAAAPVVPCEARLRATVDIQPRVTASGRRVGCISVPWSESAQFSFDSRLNDMWDKTLTDLVVTIYDGTVTFVGTVGDQYQRWTVNGHFPAPCDAGSAAGALRVLAPGSVAVTDDL